MSLIEGVPDAKVVQVLMPAGLLGRIDEWLAIAGMRLYLTSVKEETPLLMVGAVLPGGDDRPPGPWTLPEVLGAYDGAVAYLAEKRRERPTTKTRRSARRTA